MDRPSSSLSQVCTFSAHKNRNIVKVLVDITPSRGAVSFVLKVYEGSISDRKLVEVSVELNLLVIGLKEIVIVVITVTTNDYAYARRNPCKPPPVPKM